MEPRNRILLTIALLLGALIENTLRHSVLFHLDFHGDLVQNLSGENSTKGIVDGRWFYYDHVEIPGITQGTMEVYSGIGKYLEPYFRGLPVTIGMPGATNMIAYYGNFSVCINEYGITDAYIAHLSIGIRQRVGHEKKATEAYLVSRHMDFEFGQVVSKLPEHLPFNRIAFEIPEQGVWQLARVVTYNKANMEELSARFSSTGNKSILPHFEEIIPNYIQHSLAYRPLDLLEDDYAAFREIYFNRYPDTALQHPFEARIAELKLDSAKGKAL